MLRLSTFLSLSFKHRLNPSEDQYTYGYNFIYGLAGLEIEKPYNNNLFNGVRSLTAETKTYLLCADDYEATPTVDKFIKLLNKKDFYKRNNDSNSVLEKAKLEDQLNEVLNKIRWIKSFDGWLILEKFP